MIDNLGELIEKRPLKIWWVNQRFKGKEKKDTLWAPIKGRKFWENVSKVKKDDIILHYNSGSRCLHFVSRAISNPEQADDPHKDIKRYNAEKWGKKGRQVRVEPFQLEPPIPLEKINHLPSMLNIDGGPLDKNQNIKNGYLFNFSKEALNDMKKAQPETKWPVFCKQSITSSKDGVLMKSTINQTQSVHPLNVILYGPPGTGKTFATYERAVKIADPAFTSSDRAELMSRYKALRQQGQIQFITFHQSYSYEEFIEGIRPELDKESREPRYELKDGVLKQIARMASAEYNKSTTNTTNDLPNGTKGEIKINNYVLIIDEINRGNISKILGEAITLLDTDKRLDAEIETTIMLPYSQNEFVLPSNLYILGTMNTADRSIALMDIALRRRFKFEEFMPDADVLEGCLVKNGMDENLVELILKVFKVLNRRIEVLLDRDHQIGHSYFLKIRNDQNLYDVWYQEVMPLVQEYFYNDWERLKSLLKSFVIETAQDPDYVGLFNGNEPDYPCKFNTCKNPAELIELLKKSF